MKNSIVCCSGKCVKKGREATNSLSADSSVPKKKGPGRPAKTATSSKFFPIMAIDPGINGGIAILYPDGRITATKMPDSPYEMLKLFIQSSKEAEVKLAVVEDVGYHVHGNNASSSVKFARHVGNLDVCLLATGINAVMVKPQRWMKGIGVPPRLSKIARKNWIKEFVSERFPGIKVSLWNSDALAMLFWYGGLKLFDNK